MKKFIKKLLKMSLLNLNFAMIYTIHEMSELLENSELS